MFNINKAEIKSNSKQMNSEEGDKVYNTKSEIYKYDENKDDLEENKYNKESYQNERNKSQSYSQVIFSLKGRLLQSEDTINSLIDENKILKAKVSSQSSIISFFLQSLDSLTRSPITNNLINSSILSPSLEVIDKSDIKYIENDNSSKYMKENQPSMDSPFIQFQSIVDFRNKANSKVENSQANQFSKAKNQSLFISSAEFQDLQQKYYYANK